MKARKDVRQQFQRALQGHAEPYAAARPEPYLLELAVQILLHALNGARRLHITLTRRGQHQRIRVAHKEVGAQFLLHLPHHLAHRGLGDIEHLCGAADAALPEDGQHIFNLSFVHACFLTLIL